MRVITYDDPRSLRHHPDWPLIQRTPHICATESLRYGLSQHYGHLGFKGVSFARLLRHLLPRWNDPLSQVGQYARLTGKLDALRIERPAWAQRLRGFRRNQQEVLKGLRTLAEGGLHPHDLQGKTDDERIFKTLWERMETDDPLLHYLRSQLEGVFAEPQGLRTALLRAFGGVSADVAEVDLRLSRVDQFIMDGFYFITPLQMRLIRLMEKANINLIFLNCWDERYPSVFATWERFFPERSSWTIWGGSRPDPAGELFGSLYEGASLATEVKTAPRILRFPDTTALLQHLERESDPERSLESRTLFCSPAHTELNDLVRDLFPERYPERHFLAYPVGQFLFHLHQMWEEELEERVFSEAALMACFSSGLLRVRAGDRWVEGRSLTQALKQALPYFAGCRETQKWIDRARALTEALNTRVPAWETDVPKSDPAYRFHAMLANPIRLLSHLQLTVEQAKDLQLLLERLDAVADELFQDDRVSLHEHLRRLKRLLQEGGTDEHLLSEERALLHEAIALFDARDLIAEEFPSKDLAEAMTVFLGAIGKPEEEANSEGGLIREFAAIDGIALQSQPVHLCLLNDWALPAKRRAIPWPLTERSFRDSSHDAVRMLSLREQESARSALYLFYYALAFHPAVTLSWVGEWGEERQSESVFLVMLKAAGVTEEALSVGAWEEQAKRRNTVLAFHSNKSWQVDLYPPHALAEYKACPRRFYYSYLAGRTPAFESDFLLEFLYGPLLGWYMWRFPGMHQPDAKRAIDPLFPDWPKVRLRDLAQRWGRFKQPMDSYSGKRYNWVQRWLTVPAFTQLGGVKEVFESATEQQRLRSALMKGTDVQAQMTAKPSEGCRYCPHITYCRDAQMAIDDEQ